VNGALLVVGTGLVGTSIGLALEGRDVLLTDADPATLAAAVGRGAGTAWDGRTRARHGVLAVPPEAIAPSLAALHTNAASWSHVASVQAPVQAAVQRRVPPAVATLLCGAHPLAGKESSGPLAAAADLFAGRPWALCPAPDTVDAAVDAARALAVRCGAVPVELTAAEHDATVALVSHLPQVTASALAAALLGAGGPLSLAGPGLQDTTRIAASDPALWGQILTQNAAAVAPLVRELGFGLLQAADDLDAGLDLRDLLARGNRGRALVPVKRGSTDVDFAVVRVRVADRRGQLAAVLVAASAAGIDVEDVRVEHLPSRASGVIELVVAAGRLDDARARLASAGWDTGAA